jgi:two-component system nitrogen regulation sensor histidine kinase NtrY
MDNAVRAMNHQGLIRITVHIEESSFIVTIADSGPGIATQQKEQLFLPYFSQTKGGTGLGLAISDKIIKEHGGKIQVSDNIPTGSVFTIIIPIWAESTNHLDEQKNFSEIAQKDEHSLPSSKQQG